MIFEDERGYFVADHVAASAIADLIEQEVFIKHTTAPANQVIDRAIRRYVLSRMRPISGEKYTELARAGLAEYRRRHAK